MSDPVSNDARSTLREAIIRAVRTVRDPEIPVNIYDLGLIYDLDIDESGAVRIRMTLTSPACPVAGSLPGQVENAVRGVPGVSAAEVQLVWEPPWSPERMSEAARLALNMDLQPGPPKHPPLYNIRTPGR